jgi:hypothetical protein
VFTSDERTTAHAMEGFRKNAVSRGAFELLGGVTSTQVFPVSREIKRRLSVSTQPVVGVKSRTSRRVPSAVTSRDRGAVVGWLTHGRPALPQPASRAPATTNTSARSNLPNGCLKARTFEERGRLFPVTPKPDYEGLRLCG